MSISSSAIQIYCAMLRDFCETGGEEALYRASLLSHEFIAQDVTPDEIVAMHTEAVQEIVKPFDPRGLVASQQMLLEMMIAYGVRYSEYAEFRLAEARKTIEAEQNRADNAAQAEQRRLDLLATVTHELGTPLTVAKGNVSAIRRFLGENNRLSQDLANRAIDAEAAIERLLTLHGELVAASRNEVRDVELAPLHIDAAITRAVSWAMPAAQEQQVELTYEISEPGCIVIGDPDAIESILGNLLSNGVRYTPSGGSVRLSVTRALGRICVEVRDTGIGMTEEAKSHLFERFYRAPEAKEAASWGLGLGLAIASELAKALGATIEVESEVGVGSTFRVNFVEGQPSEE